MQRLLTVSIVLLALATAVPGAAPAQGQDQLASRFERATLAWDAGDYVDALEGFIDVLTASGGERFLEQIALISGELHRTEEVAVDGRNIRISGDGAFAAYETTADNRTRTHIVRLEGGVRSVMEVDGSGLVFAPSGSRAAYLEVEEDDELRAAIAALDEIDSSNRQAMREAQQQIQQLRREKTNIRIVDASAPERSRAISSALIEAGLAFSADGGTLYVAGAMPGETDRSDIYAFSLDDDHDGGLRKVTETEGFKANPTAVAGGEYLVYTIPRVSPVAASAGPRRFGAGAPSRGRFALLHLPTGSVRELDGNNPVVSADGSTLAFSATDASGTVISVLPLAADPGGSNARENGPEASDAEPRAVFRTTNRANEFQISPSGDRVVVQMTVREDWELFLVDTAEPTDGEPVEPVRLTIEIQHDLGARFLTDDTILAAMGEGRHRRSYLYDVNTLERTRLFHNNTVRTIAPEYEWRASADGTKVLIVSERDGDTVSSERAVYVVDLTRKVTAPEVVERLEWNLAAERTLRAHGERMFAPIADEVREAVSEVSMSRLYRYQKALFDFGSKNITQPGNAPAREYLRETYESFGYEAALQWFDARGRGGGEPIRTANVLAKLEGTENPELIYVVSSHFDSTARGPGADDNTSGTSMLLETARVLANRPLPYSVIFASFTGEESGLLGSREFVRQAVENSDKIVGALNNDMMGWSNDHRIDNTIRYSNKGIRDLQHAAAFLFSDLITYDALYYKSTDAAAYYEAYGDIVGGIGSYPVLGNPHYHQVHDVLETMNHEQIRETTKTNIASIMLLASSPSRLTGLEIVSREGQSVELRWNASPENSVYEYIVRYGPQDGPFEEIAVDEPRATLSDIPDGALVSVKAVSSRGPRGWDWAHVTVER